MAEQIYRVTGERLRIKLCDATRIQDIGFLEGEGEIESILINVYSPNKSITPSEVLKRASELDEAEIDILKQFLYTQQTEIGRIIIHFTLWLHLKNNGIIHLREALNLLFVYYSTFIIERDIEDELYTYRLLHNLFYHLPLFCKPDEIASLKELADFIAAYENNLENVITEIFKPAILIQPNVPF
ncbi:MAG: hypothetical protein HQK89_01700 [Nitrospirae bacterium]|nr:hypothetical protein [Nitrospirota bacterium]